MKRFCRKWQDWLLCMILLLPHTTMAEERGSFTYQGQPTEALELIQQWTEDRTRDVQVPDTCTRSVAYTDTVCEDVTKYRRDCTDVPDTVCDNVTKYRRECRDVTRTRQQCRDVQRTKRQCRTVTRSKRQCQNVQKTRQNCRNVTRTRQRCRTVGGGQNCRNVTDNDCRPVTRQVCRMRNGRKVCRDVTRQDCRSRTRRVCDNEPSRQVCTDEPYNDRVCTDEPYTDRVCRDIPYNDEICRDIPYTDKVCRSIPYTDTECRDVPYTDRVCRDIVRQDCTDIPYVVNECRDVTRYRDEPYACTRTVTQTYQATIESKADLVFDFEQILGGDFQFLFDAKLDKQKISVTASQTAGEELVILYSKNEINVTGDEDRTQIDGNFQVLAKPAAKLTQFFRGSVQRVLFEQDLIEVIVPKVEEADFLALELVLSRPGQDPVLDEKFKLTDLKIEDVVEEGTQASKITLDFKELGLDVAPARLFAFVKVRLSLSGRLLNRRNFQNLEITGSGLWDYIEPTPVPTPAPTPVPPTPPTPGNGTDQKLAQDLRSSFSSLFYLKDFSRKRLKIEMPAVAHPDAVKITVTITDIKDGEVVINKSLALKDLGFITGSGKTLAIFDYKDQGFDNLKGVFSRRPHRIKIQVELDARNSKVRRVRDLLDLDALKQQRVFNQDA